MIAAWCLLAAAVVGGLSAAAYELVLRALARRRASRAIAEAQRDVQRGFISRREAARRERPPFRYRFRDSFSIRPRAEWWTWPALDPEVDPVDARVLRARRADPAPDAPVQRVHGVAPLALDQDVLVRSVMVAGEPHPIASNDGGHAWHWWSFTPRCTCGCDLTYGAIAVVGSELGVTCPACRRRHFAGDAS